MSALYAFTGSKDEANTGPPNVIRTYFLFFCVTHAVCRASQLLIKNQIGSGLSTCKSSSLHLSTCLSCCLLIHHKR